MLILFSKIFTIFVLWAVVAGCMLSLFGITDVNPDDDWLPKKKRKRPGIGNI